MEATKNLTEKSVAQAAILMFIAYVVYFLIMKFAGFIYIAELRFFNFFIQFTGIMMLLRSLRIKNGVKLQYLEGFSIGFMASAISSLLFAIFTYFYFVLDPALLAHLKEDAPVMGKYLTPLSAGLTVLLEGLIAGLVLSFALMQYYKDDSIHKPFKKQSGPTSEEA